MYFYFIYVHHFPELTIIPNDPSEIRKIADDWVSFFSILRMAYLRCLQRQSHVYFDKFTF